jgi:hypothetical protein
MPAMGRLVPIILIGSAGQCLIRQLKRGIPKTASRGIGATCGEASPLNFCNKPLPAQHGALFEKH